MAVNMEMTQTERREEKSFATKRLYKPKIMKIRDWNELGAARWSWLGEGGRNSIPVKDTQHHSLDTAILFLWSHTHKLGAVFITGIGNQ